ncbi:Uncharacterised protein [Shigella sonnei]|nr:Uncharacterised protein [Shigella sonnei]CSR38912.1 Uncharacterised protein [Shigella sonnei]CSS69998.1 Uncharacterised protein [Shigella sonnei]
MTEQASEKIDVFIHRQGVVEVFAQPLRHPGDARADVAAMPRVAHIAAQHHHIALLNDAGTGNQRQ